jgi:NAD(P)-dependent dehydrogenase (short-subunit alcohol dehydrogenase family)
MTVALVTGANSGMGRSCLAEVEGQADVVVAVDLTAPEIEGTVGVACNIADPDDVRALADTVQELGGLRSLIHAAGISPTMGDARTILEVDLVGTQLILDAFDDAVAPGVAAVCFSSSSAYMIAAYVTPEIEELLRDPLATNFLDKAVELVGGDSGFAYALAKVGVIRAAARAAATWGRRGGRVNSLAPGLIDTPMGRQELAQQPAMQQILSNTPLGRLGQADEVAAVAAFLTSDAASFISGIDVLVDGGQEQGAKYDPQPPV